MILQIIFNFNQYIIICLTGIRCIYSKIHCNIVNIQQGKPEFFNIQFVPLQCSDNVFIIEECLICEGGFITSLFIRERNRKFQSLKQ